MRPIANKYALYIFNKFTVNRYMSTESFTSQTSSHVQSYVESNEINFIIGQPSAKLIPNNAIADGLVYSANKLVMSDPYSLQYANVQGCVDFRTNSLLPFISRQYYSKEEDHSHLTPNEISISYGNSFTISQCTRVFSKMNDVILMENPSYFLAKNMFIELGRRVHGIPVDKDGVNVDIIEEYLSNENSHIAFIYLIPTYHNPTGVVLSNHRRRRLIEMSVEYGFKLITDEPYTMLNFGNSPRHRPLYTYCQNPIEKEHVITLESFSKILTPGLRLGWIISSPTNIKYLSSDGVLNSGGGPPPALIGTLKYLIDNSFIDLHLTHLRDILYRRKEQLLTSINTYLHLYIKSNIVDPKGGYFISIEFNKINTRKLQKMCKLTSQVNFLVGGHVHVDDGFDKDKFDLIARFSFAFYEENEIEIGIERISKVILEYGEDYFI